MNITLTWSSIISHETDSDIVASQGVASRDHVPTDRIGIVVFCRTCGSNDVKVVLYDEEVSVPNQ